MKRVGIATFVSGDNYGQALQNLALQTVLENLYPHQVRSETLCARDLGCHLMRTREAFRFHLGEIARKVYPSREMLWKFPLILLNEIYRFGRKITFAKQLPQYIHYFPRLLEKNWDCINTEIADEFNGFIAGSDQVWNPEIGGDPLYLLSFARPSQRFSYAASVCVSAERMLEFPEVIEGICQMQHISVRELDGVKVLQKVTGREVRLDLDPTLLMNGDEWRSLCRLPKPRKKKELFMVELIADNDMVAWSNQFARRKGLKLRCPKFEAPVQWLKRIQDAELVVTNSFHATVFAILLGTPVVYSAKRNQMNSRMQNLMDITGLGNRDYREISEDRIMHMDFETAWKHLEDLLPKSKQYLAQILNEMEGEPLYGEACI